MNHSAQFYAEVEKVFPEYRRCQRWLKENGSGYLKMLCQRLISQDIGNLPTAAQVSGSVIKIIGGICLQTAKSSLSVQAAYLPLMLRKFTKCAWMLQMT